jgi:hypothetical protein
MSNINTGTSNIPIPDNAYARWRRAKHLSYLTAWQQTQPKDYRTPSALESEQNKEAVRMLTLIASLDYFIYDLIDEMEAAVMYKQGNKRNINRCKELIEKAHMVFYKRLFSYEFGGCSKYNDAMDTYYNAINECVSLEEPERAYNIIVAIVRLQAKCRKRIDMRYFYQPSQDLEHIPSLLECLGIHDYNLDNIIEQKIRAIKFRVKK